MIDRLALLRGINVGGHRVKMAELRAIFESMGFRNVATHIASGNVMFTSDDPDDARNAARIEAGLVKALGYEVLTFLRSYEAMRDVVGAVPEIDFGSAVTTGGPSTYVVFLKEAVDEALRSRFEALESELDRFTFRDREIFWSLAGRMSDSPLFRQGIEKAGGGSRMTTRNVTTVRTLANKLAERRG
jgi:uncharacterized protein (DUF1697 family)